MTLNAFSQIIARMRISESSVSKLSERQRSSEKSEAAFLPSDATAFSSLVMAGTFCASSSPSPNQLVT